MKLLLLIPLLMFSCDKGTTIPTTSPAAQAINRGIARTREKALCAGYTKAVNPGVELKTGADVQIAPVSGIPAIRQKNDDYKCDAQWDPDCDGTILVSGFYDENADRLVLPYVPGREADLENAASNEMEHCVLRFNDSFKYRGTLVHGTIGHPLLSECR